MMIKKIISGAQTGADRAALDFALNNDIPHGGWVPKGRKAEDGIIPAHYHVTEAPTDEYARRTELNVRDADGTLIFSHGSLRGGSLITEKLARKYGKPCLHIDFNRKPEFQATVDITHWISVKHIEILNVAGSRAGHDPKIYKATLNILEMVLYLGIIEEQMPDMLRTFSDNDFANINSEIPESIDQALAQLTADLPLKDRIRLAAMAEADLDYLDPSLGDYIKSTYHINDGNEKLMSSCRKTAADPSLTVDDAVGLMIKTLWMDLKKTHLIRRVK